MSSLTIRKVGSSWQYRAYIGKKGGESVRYQKSGFASKKEARIAGEQIINEYYSHPQKALQQSVLDFSSLLDYWFSNYCVVNLKQTTCEGYRKRIQNVIKPRIGSISLNNLTPMVLQTFINEIFNEGYSRNALGSVKGILSCSLRFAVSPAGLLSVNPASSVRLPHMRAKPKTKAREKERQPITTDDWQRVITRFPREHPSHIPLMLGYHLGLRLGEVFGLCWEDVDFAAGTITVKHQVQYDNNRKSWYFTPPKYDSCRTITMDDELTALLADEKERQTRAKEYFADRYHQVCVDSDNVFVSDGRPVHLLCVRQNGSYIQPRTMMHTNHIAHTELNLPLFDFHTLRHTHATMLLEAGASLFDIKERLGHTKIEVTQRYVHNTDIQRRRTTQILNSIYSKT